MTYNPALDGMRAFAILLVAMFHTRAPMALGGYIGVDIFFVLSGFLITSLLLAELDATGRVALASFWRRRFWRLTPPLLAMLAVYLLLAPLAWPEVANHGLQALLAALYVSDYSAAFWGVPRQLSHTWSLSVEMHFYLLWPLVLVFAYRRWKGGSLVPVLAVAYLLASMLRWVCTIKGQSWEQVYYRTDTHLSGLLLGSWLAVALRDPAWRDGLQQALPWLLWLPVAAIVCLQYMWRDLWMQMWGFSLVELAAAAVVLAVQRPSSQLSLMLSRPVLVWLGKMSYGIYLWHFPVFLYLRVRHTWGEVMIIGLSLSVALAALSHYTLEAWASRRRGLRAPMQAAG
ncbi:acyltransferase family protein [Ramlibacter montanisoli]|uniref:Acyltransferase n=1 Tax=Ramlibacter montanisoli TaxID=2732512 RepID=A0A849KFW7_9BURK|nr:acyltransferase [Ramlibacter montanisoli]NNU43815.1 acyltransferase [Ramlibacter montanisoli]